MHRVLRGQTQSRQVHDLLDCGLPTLAAYALQWWTYCGERWRRPFEMVTF